MSRILYFMIGMPSCYNSGITLATRLQQSGFEVDIACEKDISELLAGSGLGFHHLKENSEFSEALQKSLHAYPHRDRFRFLLYKLKLFREYRKRSLTATELKELCSAVSPDAFLIDIEFHYAIVASLNSGIPTCLVSRWFSNQSASGIPPLHSLSQPSNSFRGAFLIRLEWMKLSVFRFRKALFEWFSRSRLGPVQYKTISGVDLRALANAQGITLKPQITQQDWLIPHSYTRIPIVSLTAGEMDFPNVSTRNFHYAGPMVSGRNHAFRIEGSVISTIDGFIQDARLQKQKLIYCSLGTFLQTDEIFIHNLLELATKRDDLAFIVSMGGLPKNSQVHSSLPDNVLMPDVVPQIELLKRADAAIIHAGIASINEAITADVPFISYSVGTNDQNGCCARLKYHNLCETYPIGSISSSDIEASLDRTMAENRYDEIRSAMQRIFLSYESDNVCTKLFTSLLK